MTMIDQKLTTLDVQLEELRLQWKEKAEAYNKAVADENHKLSAEIKHDMDILTVRAKSLKLSQEQYRERMKYERRAKLQP